MPTSTDPHVEALAKRCVNDMGDIFWDFNAERDAAGQYADPRQVALESVTEALSELARRVDTSVVYPASLRNEYERLVVALPEAADDQAIVDALVSNSAWTEQGGTAVLQLARRYGCSVLRNALALAEALDIEDGDAGL